MPDRTTMAPPAPTSPCINVCVLDASGHCTGCRRHVQEISRWSRMSAEEQWAVIEVLPGRGNAAVARRASAS